MVGMERGRWFAFARRERRRLIPVGQISHARQYPRRAGSNIKVLNDDSIETRWIQAHRIPYRGGRDVPDAKGEEEWRGT